MHRTRRYLAVSLFATTAMALAGCGADDVADTALSESTGEVTAGQASSRSGGQGAASEVDPVGPGDGDVPSPRSVEQRVAAGREIVRTAEITLEFDDPEAAVDEVTRVADEAGGFVATADLQRNERTGELGGTMTLRIPSSELTPALNALEAMAADTPIRRLDSADVTAEAVDLRAQVRNLTAYETELRAMLTEVREATSDPDRLLPLFDRVQSVRSDIDRLTAQLEALEDHVALSTVTVTLRPTAGSDPIAAAPGWAPGRTFEAALTATTRIATGLADAAIWLVVTLLPAALVLLGPLVAIWWAWNRRRPELATAAAGPSPAPTAGDASPPPEEPPAP